MSTKQTRHLDFRHLKLTLSDSFENQNHTSALQLSHNFVPGPVNPSNCPMEITILKLCYFCSL